MKQLEYIFKTKFGYVEEKTILKKLQYFHHVIPKIMCRKWHIEVKTQSNGTIEEFSNSTESPELLYIVNMYRWNTSSRYTKFNWTIKCKTHMKYQANHYNSIKTLLLDYPLWTPECTVSGVHRRCLRRILKHYRWNVLKKFQKSNTKKKYTFTLTLNPRCCR